MARPGLTIADIRDMYPEEKRLRERNNLWGYFVLRKSSYYLAWLFLKLGISANSVTLVGFILGFVGCGLLAFGNHISIIVGASLINLWALFEFADGSVARYSGSRSEYGAFIDNLSGGMISALLFISAGIGAFRQNALAVSWLSQAIWGINIDSVIFLVLGGWASLFYIYSRFIGNQFEKAFAVSSNVVSQFKGELFSSTMYRKIHINLNNTTALVMPALLLAAIFSSLGSFVMIWVLITTGATFVLMAQLLRKAGSHNVSKRK